MASFETGLNLTVIRKHKDGATCALPIREDLLNGTGVLHGGVIASIADEVAWWAILTVLDRSDRKMTTTELKVNYLRPIVGKKVTARGYVLKLGRTLAVTRIDILDEKRRLAAHATVTYAMLG
jgi:acyl-CoA thioesterase